MNLFAIVALAIGGVTMSFKMASTATVWHYTDTENPGVFNDAANWEQGAASGCLPSGTKPCQISVDAANETELATYLSGMDNDDVLAINSTSRRN